MACLSLPELEQVVALEIDRYNHTTHDGIGDRPIDRYLAYYRRPDLADDQRVPPLLPAERLLLDFLPYERRRLVRTGFRLFRVDYSGRDLLAMWRRAEPGADRAHRRLRPAQPGEGLGRGRCHRRLRRGALIASRAPT